MERYLKDAEPQIKPEPVDLDVDHVLDFDNSWIKSEFDEDFAIKHELLIKSEPSDLDDTDDDRLSLDDLNIWDRGLCNSSVEPKTTPPSSAPRTAFMIKRNKSSVPLSPTKMSPTGALKNMRMSAFARLIVSTRSCAISLSRP